MGAVCCGEKKGHTGVLDKNHLQHNLVSSKTKDFHDVYEIVELIGEGSISRISKVRKKGEKDGTMYALKEIELSLVKKEYIDELINEIELLKGIDHPDIIKAYETFKLKNRMAIVMELLTGGDLYARQPYSERDTSIIVFQILTAVAYLHSRNIVHRDLKHENIMFASKHTSYIDVKVIDFGTSFPIGSSSMTSVAFTVSFLTFYFLAKD
jgi:calcium-dependent protein kinase